MAAADVLCCLFLLFLIIILPLAGFLIPAIWGMITEKNHLKDLEQREANIKEKMVVHNRKRPMMPNPRKTTVVAGEVCIGADRFKTWLAKWRQLVGGRMGSLAPVVERARREATLRMIENAQKQGFTEVGNVRYTTANLKWNVPQQKELLITVTAYGTAWGA
jgi:uncharacterized protein YbjQ (UPF0145 family)